MVVVVQFAFLGAAVVVVVVVAACDGFLFCTPSCPCIAPRKRRKTRGRLVDGDDNA